MKFECGPEWDMRNVYIDEKIDPSRTAILMSGGLDSFVLYTLLGDKNIGKVFSLKRADRLDNSDNLKRLIGRNDIIDINEDPQWTGENRITNLLETVLSKYNNEIDALYFGINHIPSLYHFPEFAEGCPVRPWFIDNSKILKTPFLHLYKYHIIDLAERLALDVTVTRSCLELEKDHCGVCWQCRERNWGYQQLGHEGDPTQPPYINTSID
jgi:hypothetical protein